jgi:hypothetical protein
MALDGEAFRKYLAQLEAFNRWVEENPPEPRPLADVLADIGLIWSMLPEEIRTADPDPEKKGIRAMHEIFARVDAYQSRKRE